ncbi:hypothetical protein WA158_006817 [Blastocystis sp. Blastoise]
MARRTPHCSKPKKPEVETPKPKEVNNVDDDNSSVVSDTLSYMSDIPDSYDGSATSLDNGDYDDSVQEAIDFLYDKKKDTKMGGINLLIKYLKTYKSIRVYETNIQTIFDELLRIINAARDYSPSCFKLIEIMIIVFGIDHDELYSMLKPSLFAICKTGSNVAIRSCAIHCISLAAFVCNVEPSEVEEIIDLFYSIFMNNDNSDVFSYAVNGFIFLLTIKSIQEIISYHFIDCLNAFLSFLDHSNEEVREAAGQALVFYLEIYNTCESKNISVASFDKDEVIDAIEDMTHQHYSGISRERAVQHKALFRQYLAYLNGEEPSLKYKTNLVIIQLNTWSRIIQFYYLEDTLGGALFLYCQVNPLIENVFDGCITENEKQIISHKAKEFRSKERLSYEDNIKKAESNKNYYLNGEYDEE